MHVALRRSRLFRSGQRGVGVITGLRKHSRYRYRYIDFDLSLPDLAPVRGRTHLMDMEDVEFEVGDEITIYFDDTDEYFLNLPESVTVFKIREPGNFDFETHRWVYDDRTGQRLRG